MTRSAAPKPVRRPGSGRTPIPADVYLARWSSVVESLNAGHTTGEIKAKFGTCAQTVRHVRRFLVAGGWTPPVRVPMKRETTKAVRPQREPRPPKAGMTAAERLDKYPGIVAWLRTGKKNAEIAAFEGVSVNTVRVVKRALAAMGEMQRMAPESKSLSLHAATLVPGPGPVVG